MGLLIGDTLIDDTLGIVDTSEREISEMEAALEIILLVSESRPESSSESLSSWMFLSLCRVSYICRMVLWSLLQRFIHDPVIRG